MEENTHTNKILQCSFDLKMETEDQNEFIDDRKIELGFEPDTFFLLVDITGFLSLIQSCFEKAGAIHRKKRIASILSSKDWVIHYQDPQNGRRVLAESDLIKHKHELVTATYLAKMNYDVVFAPKGMFKREEKKFDIFLLRDTIILKADLKSITSKNPDTLAKRIKSGSDQASRIVIDINSDIEKKGLIDGLRYGVEKNEIIKEILLCYKGRFYRLPKNLILSKHIYKLIK